MELSTLGGVPLALAIVELFKPVTPAKFYPFVAVFVGIVWTLITSGITSLAALLPALPMVVTTGALIGLAAAGVYSAGKQLIQDNATPDPPPPSPAAIAGLQMLRSQTAPPAGAVSQSTTAAQPIRLADPPAPTSAF